MWVNTPFKSRSRGFLAMVLAESHYLTASIRNLFVTYSGSPEHVLFQGAMDINKRQTEHFESRNPEPVFQPNKLI